MPRLNLKEDILPLSEFRADAAGRLAQVRQTQRPLVLTQRGHSSAVVLDVAQYQQILEELELLRDIHTAVRQVEAGEAIPHAEAQRRALLRLRA